MVKIVRTKTRRAIVDAARRSAKTARSVAGDALGAAAKAATGVVLDSTAKVLEIGRARIERDSPSMQRTAGKVTRRAVSGRTRKTTRGRTRKTITARKKSTPKRRSNAAKQKAKRRAR